MMGRCAIACLAAGLGLAPAAVRANPALPVSIADLLRPRPSAVLAPAATFAFEEAMLARAAASAAPLLAALVPIGFVPAPEHPPHRLGRGHRPDRHLR